MEKMKDLIIAFVAAKGITKVVKIIAAVIFAALLMMVGGIPVKILAIFLFIGFIRCLF